MEVIQLKPSNRLTFKIPNNLTTKFTIGNLTLRTVGIYAVPLHPDAISVSSKAILIDAFQEAELTVILHWSQSVNSSFKSKLRIYIWQLYDDESLPTVVSKMFDKQTDGNCLLFQELAIQIDYDENYMRKMNCLVPNNYVIDRISLPNNLTTNVTQQMVHKVLNHCEKLGKVKAIYTHGHQYVVQFSQLEDIVCSFCEVRDSHDKLAIFAIRSILNIGSIICSPDILYLMPSKSQNCKSSSKKQIKREVQQKKSQQQQQTSQKKQISEQQDFKNLQKKQRNIQTSQFEQQAPSLPSLSQNKNKAENHHTNQNRSHIHQKNKKDLVKQSFFVAPEKSRGIVRKRTRSQQLIIDPEDCDYSSASIDIQQINSWRNATNFQIKPQQVFEEKSMDFSKKILNIQLSADQRYVYLLMRDCLIICQVNLSSKRIIKFDPIDSENIHLPTPMIVLNKQRSVIFANQSYLFWVSLVGEEQPDWKYVQRKQIYAIEVIEELNLLMVGGKNFSKLAYLGKSTGRSNIKVYSSGKTGKRDHLFTYDIPNCNGENVIQLKYITTKPNGTKLLLAVTHLSKLFFLRVRAFNHIQVYSCLEANQIGIQQIVSLNYYLDSGILICLEKLSDDAMCFKYVKVNCSYEKVEIATESVKLPVAKYLPYFRIGGKLGSEWLTAIDSKNSIYCYYLSQSEAQKTEYNSTIRDCILLKKGAIFRQSTGIRCRILKQ